MKRSKGIWEKRRKELENYLNQGLSNKEIAGKFNCTENAIAKALYRLNFSKKSASKSINWEKEKLNLKKLLDEGRTIKSISDLYNISETTLRRHLKELDLKKKRININSNYKSDINSFKQAVNNSKSFSDVCINLGLRPAGGNITSIKKRIEKLNLDISHFDYGKSKKKKNIINDDDLFSKSNPLTSRSQNSNVIKSRLLSKNYKEHKCECCGNTEWNGKPIPLQLHHINGDYTDNRLTNLQLLCPNCHAQTDNYCKRKPKNPPSENP